MHPGLTRATLALAVLTASLSGCTAANQPEPSERVELTLTTYDAAGTPGAALVEHFLEEATRLDPSLAITPQYARAPQEPDAVTAVSDGSADLVMVASRAFDTAGVTTLQALNTPFLIDSNAVANGVATSELVPDLLAGLEQIGVIGLAIAPEGMRHLFADDDPVVEVRDLDGTTVRSPQSQAVWSLLAAAGATPIFDDTRRYQVSESQYDGELRLGVTAGNLTLFPKYDVLAINARSAQQLSPAQLDALRQAAAASASWAVAHVENDAAMAGRFCANGGQIVAATPGQLAAWESLAKSVVEDLRTTGSTAELIDAITAIKEGIDAEQPVTACPGVEQTVEGRLNGTYEFTATAEAFAEMGVHDQAFIDMNAGEYTVTLKDGEMTQVQHMTSGPRAGETESDTKTYTMEGDIVTFRWSTMPRDFTKAKVTVLADGSLAFSDWVEGMPEPKFLLQDKVTLRHWKRIK